MVADAERYINDSSEPPIKRATLLAELPATQPAMRLAMAQMESEDELIRMAAVRFMSSGPPELVKLLLPRMEDDETAVVRIEAGRGLVSLLPQSTPEEISTMSRVIEAYRESLGWSSDLPSTRTSMGMLAYSEGDRAAAESLLGSAIAIEPHFVPALLNLADLYREKGTEPEALALLEEAVRVAPDRN